MAEKAAHITSSLQARPSIFELIAQESLSGLLYPSFKIIVQFLESSNSQRYQWLSEWNEEVFLGINGLLQLHYLNTKGASFSESFYGLYRMHHGENLRLSDKAKYWSLFCLVVLPYLSRKVEKYVVKFQDRKVGKAANVCHKISVASWQCVSLVQYLWYLTGRVSAHSPLLSVANLSLQYSMEQATHSYSWRECLSSPRACARLVSDGLTQGLQLAAFFLQCLQWYHSDQLSHDKLSNLIPHPPVVEEINILSPAQCPVCKKPCRIETVLMTSGYVFCYRCIREAIVARQSCPVTNLPATLDELIRLFPNK
ncbi:peroxisome assembly protein 12-like [Homalodisca vitripennis]|uniref:peroxisome assembly protein 12-like n=1 Tax=Homalodisca vitripennis TaxID=197043 RepID=UPI001EEA9CD3|nr:peroxisome assembly protein 12-like [Homalodisca vitripennis]